MTFVPQFNVPEIYVDDEPQQDQPDEHRDTGQDGTGPVQEWSMLSPSRPEAGPSQLPRLDTSVASRLNSEERSPSEWSNISISLSPNRDRANTTGSYDPGPERPTIQPPRSADHSRNNSAMSVNDVMASLGDSAWGESIRRSFTQRRRSRDET
jgi:hypothetical protein